MHDYIIVSLCLSLSLALGGVLHHFYQHAHHSYSIFLIIITIGSGSTSILCRHDFHHHDYLADSSERNIEWSVPWHPLYTGLPLMALPWTISHIAVVINTGACPNSSVLISPSTHPGCPKMVWIHFFTLNMTL